jgi:hypothetical protein
MSHYVYKYEADPDIGVKRMDPATLKTVVYPAPVGLIAPKVGVDRTIAAALQIAKDIHRFKFEKLQGIGTEKIDTNVCVNHYGTMFTVNEKTSKEQALELYNLKKRRERRERLGIKLV